MTVQDLDDVWKAVPFRPFTICLADTRQIHVPHPDFLSRPPKSKGSTVIVYGEGDGFTVLDLKLVTQLKIEDQSSSGSRRRRSTR
jgi:hypothetical protein